MSLSSWKKEFFPMKARESKSVTEAIEHSLLKWNGLRKKAMASHGMHKKRPADNFIFDDQGAEFCINDDSCALCFVFENDCDVCPLGDFLGHPCDYPPGRGALEGPYSVWFDTGNPLPMIEALKGCLKAYKREHKKGPRTSREPIVL